MEDIKDFSLYWDKAFEKQGHAKMYNMLILGPLSTIKDWAKWKGLEALDELKFRRGHMYSFNNKNPWTALMLKKTESKGVSAYYPKVKGRYAKEIWINGVRISFNEITKDEWLRGKKHKTWAVDTSTIWVGSDEGKYVYVGYVYGDKATKLLKVKSSSYEGVLEAVLNVDKYPIKEYFTSVDYVDIEVE